MLWGSALTKAVESYLYKLSLNFDDKVYTHSYSKNIATESALFGTVSLALTIINILAIIVMGITVLKVKISQLILAHCYIALTLGLIETGKGVRYRARSTRESRILGGLRTKSSR